jgi:TolA protein
MMGLAYIQSERGRNYLAEQLRQASGQAGTTGTAPPPPTTVSPPSTGQAPGAPAVGNTTATVEPPKPLDEVAMRAEVDKFAALFKSRVTESWSIPPGSAPDLRCLLKIELQPDGKVQNVGISQSSGDEAFDHSAVAAVRKAAPFPLPDNPDAAAKFKSFKFSFKSNPGG